LTLPTTKFENKGHRRASKSIHTASEVKKMFQYLFAVHLPFTANCNTITASYGG
jgi:hypothetical protein